MRGNAGVATLTVGSVYSLRKKHNGLMLVADLHACKGQCPLHQLALLQALPEISHPSLPRLPA